jgi:predicted metal-dependent hydrolase
MANGDEYDSRYLAGIEQFNRGDYFAAHEVWEELWRDCPAADRGFYQALIQAAVALYHHERGNSAGADRLFRSAQAKSAAYPERYRGLQIRELWQAIAAKLEPEPGRLPPGIRLEPPPSSRE